MSHAVIDGDGRVRQLDRLSEPDEQVTPYEVGSPEKLARFLVRLLKEVRQFTGLWRPRVMDSQALDVDGTGTTIYRIEHGFRSRVNWWVIDYTGGTVAALVRDVSTDENALCFVSNEAGTVRVRVEEAG